MAENAVVTSVGSSGASGDDPVRERLFTRGWEFDFFQAVWLLERSMGAAVRVGERGPSADEPLRFRPDVGMGFAPTDVRRIMPLASEGEGQKCLLEVTFLGLYGVSTPLPLHYAVQILRAVDGQTPVAPPLQGRGPEERAIGRPPLEGAHPERDFLDLIHHRLTALFYRAWLKYRYDRTFVLEGRDVLTGYLRWLIGVAPDVDAAQLGVSPIRMIRYAGALTQHPRSAAMLEGLLRDYWGDLAVRVEQHIGRFVSLSASDLNRIGMANSALGVDLTVGAEVYDLSGAFRVSLGPVDWETYYAFLPDGGAHARTRALVRLFCADPLRFDLEVKLSAGQAPPLRLSSDARAGRLGYTGWVQTDEMAETSVVFDESSAVAAAGVEFEAAAA
jgi:type VI secretion system protein ImpH